MEAKKKEAQKAQESSYEIGNRKFELAKQMRTVV